MQERVMLIYPPGKLYQRGEDRCQSNIDESAANSIHACNDLGYAASVLRNKDYQVFLKDYQTEGKRFQDVLKDVFSFRPDLVFLSITNGSIYRDIAFINQLVAAFQCRIVIKGAIFFDITLRHLEKLNLEHVDCCVGGEVEFIIGDLVDALLRGEGRLEDIPGIVFKTTDGFQKTDFSFFCPDVDALPFPARDLMNNALYTRPDTGETMATISVARGCPSQCIYCLTPIISGRRARCRSADNVFREMEECYFKYEISSFFFKADTFTLDESFVCALCDKIIQSELCGHIAFTANARADCVSPELLKKMKAAGCFMLAVGFESGNDETLSKIKKGITVEKNLRAAQMIKAAGIPLFGFFMIGFPWETAAMIKETEQLIHRINPDFLELHIAMPFYGTQLYAACAQAGVLSGSGFGYDYYAPNTTGTAFLSAKEVDTLKRGILLRFYLRPRYIARKMIKAAGRPRTVFNYIRYGVHLLKKNLFLGGKTDLGSGDQKA